MKCDELKVETVVPQGSAITLQMYGKAEVDAAIEELKAQKAQAEDDCAFWKSKYKECKRELDLLKDTHAFYNANSTAR